jgi:hypothetical protein
VAVFCPRTAEGVLKLHVAVGTMVEFARALNGYLNRVLNHAKQPRSVHYDSSERDSLGRQQRGTDEIGLGGSDPQHYIWAPFSPKTGGRYRPNRRFRSRSFFTVEVRHSFFSKELARALGERNAYL